MKKSRQEMAAEEAVVKRGRLPSLWKASLFISQGFASLGGWLYASGTWSTQRNPACEIGLTSLDAFMVDSIAMCAIFAFFSLVAAFSYLEK